MELNYVQNGDYLIPDLTLHEEEPAYGKYGRLRKRYLQQQRKGFYGALLLQRELVAHLNNYCITSETSKHHSYITVINTWRDDL